MNINLTVIYRMVFKWKKNLVAMKGSLVTMIVKGISCM